MINILYRISDGSYNKRRLEYATKYNCLMNTLKVFKNNNIIIFTDGIKEDNTKKIIEYARQNYKIIDNINAGSSAASFRYVLNYALNNFKDEDIILFTEDDYLHLENSDKIINDLLLRSPYCCLYLHPDKAIPASKGGNPEIGEDGGEVTKLYEGKYCHFSITNSTTLTFASTIKILKEDKDIWEKYIQGTYPEDFKIFTELRNKGRGLTCPIPTYATHCEIPWVAKFIDWSKTI